MCGAVRQAALHAQMGWRGQQSLRHSCIVASALTESVATRLDCSVCFSKAYRAGLDISLCRLRLGHTSGCVIGVWATAEAEGMARMAMLESRNEHTNHRTRTPMPKPTSPESACNPFGEIFTAASQR